MCISKVALLYRHFFKPHLFSQFRLLVVGEQLGQDVVGSGQALEGRLDVLAHVRGRLQPVLVVLGALGQVVNLKWCRISIFLIVVMSSRFLECLFCWDPRDLSSNPLSKMRKQHEHRWTGHQQIIKLVGKLFIIKNKIKD